MQNSLYKKREKQQQSISHYRIVIEKSSSGKRFHRHRGFLLHTDFVAPFYKTGGTRWEKTKKESAQFNKNIISDDKEMKRRRDY